MASATLGELPRDEAALQLDFGLFDRVEIGLTSVRHNQQKFFIGQILKCFYSAKLGLSPNVAVGLENIGDSIENGLNDTERYERKIGVSCGQQAVRFTPY